MSDIDFVDARPINGYLTHAVRYNLEMFHRTAPHLVITYAKALCGVGRGGMRIRLNEGGEIQPYAGIGGCDTCFIRVRDAREGNA